MPSIASYRGPAGFDGGASAAEAELAQLRTELARLPAVTERTFAELLESPAAAADRSAVVFARRVLEMRIEEAKRRIAGARTAAALFGPPPAPPPAPAPRGTRPAIPPATAPKPWSRR